MIMRSQQIGWLAQNLEIIINDNNYNSYSFEQKKQHDYLRNFFLVWLGHIDINDQLELTNFNNNIVVALKRCWVECAKENKSFLNRTTIDFDAYIKHLNEYLDRNHFPRMVGGVLQHAAVFYDVKGFITAEVVIPEHYTLVIPGTEFNFQLNK